MVATNPLRRWASRTDCSEYTFRIVWISGIGLQPVDFEAISGPNAWQWHSGVCAFYDVTPSRDGKLSWSTMRSVNALYQCVVSRMESGALSRLHRPQDNRTRRGTEVSPTVR